MRLTGTCDCSTQIIFETDTIDNRVQECFRCGKEVKLQNRYSDKDVSTILEDNATEKDEVKEKKKEKSQRIVRKSFKDAPSGKRRGRPRKS